MNEESDRLDDPAAPFRRIAERAEEQGDDDWARVNHRLAEIFEDHEKQSNTDQ